MLDYQCSPVYRPFVDCVQCVSLLDISRLHFQPTAVKNVIKLFVRGKLSFSTMSGVNKDFYAHSVCVRALISI